MLATIPNNPKYKFLFGGLSINVEKNADEKNRTSTSLRPQASETCASTSSATSARAKGKANDTNLIFKVQERDSSLLYLLTFK